MAIAKDEQIAAWVEAARRGDHAAFGQLVRQFQDAVAGVALARLGPGPDIEDVAQEAFIAAYRQLDAFRDPARFGAWVCGIARNLSLRWLRDRRRSVALPADLAAPASSELPDLAEKVMASVRTLPERLREPLTLFYIDGYSTGEVADLLDLPAGTVRRRLHEARNRLRKHMEATMEDEIKRSSPRPDFPEAVLDRIADIQITAAVPDEDSRGILVTDDAGRSFRITIAKREGEALEEALGQRPPGRYPLLYDLLLAVERRFDTSVRGVTITELKQQTVYARIDLTKPYGLAQLDARPSDAINLAVRAGIGMQVVRDVTRQACEDAEKEKLRLLEAAATGKVIRRIRYPPSTPRKPVAELQPGPEAPDCPGCPPLWPVCRVAFELEPGTEDRFRVIVTGPDDQQVILTGSTHSHRPIASIVSGGKLPRPMTEDLAGEFIAASDLTCHHVVIGPPDEQGERIARQQIGDRKCSEWFDAHPIDAIGVALASETPPAVWVCDSAQPIK